MVFFGHIVDLFIAFLTWIGLLNPNPVDTVIPTTSIEPSLVDTTWPPDWQEILLETEPIANLETCFVTHSDGKAYLLGGLVDGNTCAYDAATQTWDNSLAPPPVRLTHMQCLSIGDSIWIPTAWTGPSNEYADDTEFIYLYHPANDTWTTKPGLPPDRRRGSAAAVYRPEARQIHVSHGNRGGHGGHSTALGWHDVFDLDAEAWSVRPDAPHPRDHAGGALLQNGAVFCVAGGRNSGYRGFWWWERYEDAVVLPTDCYDFATETWSVRAEIPTGRAGSAYGLTCDGTQLVVAGGEASIRPGSKWKPLTEKPGRDCPI